MSLDPLDHVGFDSAHVIAHVAYTHGLEERNQRLLVHVELLGDLVDPDFAHAPRSNVNQSASPSRAGDDLRQLRPPSGPAR
jgi:hypothetical protein